MHDFNPVVWETISGQAKQMDNQVFNTNQSEKEERRITFWKELLPFILKIETGNTIQ